MLQKLCPDGIQTSVTESQIVNIVEVYNLTVVWSLYSCVISTMKQSIAITYNLFLFFFSAVLNLHFLHYWFWQKLVLQQKLLYSSCNRKRANYKLYISSMHMILCRNHYAVYSRNNVFLLHLFKPYYRVMVHYLRLETKL